MTIEIDYYFGSESPWVYLGHSRFVALAAAAGAKVNVLPVDLGSIFPATGGVRLSERAEARRAYRQVELRRHARHLGLPLTLEPRFFPVDGNMASRLIVAAGVRGGAAAACTLAAAVLRTVWVDERDISEASTLACLLADCNLPGELLLECETPSIRSAYARNAQLALAAGVFGAPSYVFNGEIFWGQDRLLLLEEALGRSTAHGTLLEDGLMSAPGTQRSGPGGAPP